MAVMPQFEVLVHEVQASDAAIKVNKLEIQGDRGPVLLDGKEMKNIAGINLEWNIYDEIWRVEFKTVVLL